MFSFVFLRFSGEAILLRESKIKIELELVTFFSSQRPASTRDILVWLKKAEEKMLLLPQYVRKIFCFSSIQSKHRNVVYCASGQNISDRRSRLDLENVDMIVYRQLNLKRVQLKIILLETDEEKCLRPKK